MRYYFLKDKLQPYVSIEAGISYTHMKVDYDVNFWGNSRVLHESYSSTGVSLGFGIGFNYILSENLGLDIQAATQHQEKSYEYIHVLAGLRFGL